MPSLIVERGREKGQTYELASGVTVVIGRDPAGAQIVIADAAASRRHFQLESRNGRWYCADLGSKNFTYVNEEKLEREVELATGDRVQVGETVFTFNDDQKADDKAAGLAGKEIGGYKILERIGRGGMGTVFKAKQISLNRLVALKFLSPKLSKDPAFVAKFFAEARAAAQLNHPNVVQVFDVGTLSGVHFFSMEFMEGGCVQDLLTAREDSRLPWQEALPLIIDSVRGLVFAEKRGIIHRDIKPDNLMLTSEQKVKIGDLGLATSAEGEKEKGIFGTPHFIAPEQAQGRDLTHAADLYALGGTFYRMVTGRTPFTGSTVKEILRAQINDPHTPIPQIVPDFPPELSAIVDKLMAKKIENRYQSATKLLEDLEAFQLAHQIELAGGVRSRKPFLIAVALLLAALAGLGLYIWLRPEKPPQVVEVRDKKAEEELKRQREEQERLRREQEVATAEANARISFLEIQGDDRALGEIALAKKDEWENIAKAWDVFVQQHPDAETYVKQAKARAQEIRDTLKRLEEHARTVVKAATDWWAQVDKDLTALMGNGAWGDAVRRARQVLEGEELKTHRAFLPKEAEPWLKEIHNTAYDDATRENQNVMTEAERLLREGDPARGILSIETWEERLRKQGLDDVDGRWKQLAEAAKSWRESRVESVRKQLGEALENDKQIFVAAARALRRLPRDPADAGGVLWNYRFGDAAKELRTACEGRLKTHLYQDRALATAQRLDAAQVAWDGFVKALGVIWGPTDEIRDVRGIDRSAKVFLDPERPATSSEVYVSVAVTNASSDKALSWAEYTPSEIYKSWIDPRLDKLPAELHLGLGTAFALLGELEGAEELLGRATDTDKTWLIAEVRALQDWEAIRRGEHVGAALVSRCDKWTAEHFRSEAFLLLDGRSAEETRHLFPEEDLALYVQKLGRK